jgi:hypothetical protein
MGLLRGWYPRAGLGWGRGVDNGHCGSSANNLRPILGVPGYSTALGTAQPRIRRHLTDLTTSSVLKSVRLEFRVHGGRTIFDDVLFAAPNENNLLTQPTREADPALPAKLPIRQPD